MTEIFLCTFFCTYWCSLCPPGSDIIAGLGARTSDGRAGAGVVGKTTPVELMSDAGAFPMELTEVTQVSGGARI